MMEEADPGGTPVFRFRYSAADTRKQKLMLAVGRLGSFPSLSNRAAVVATDNWETKKIQICKYFRYICVC